MRRRVDLSSKMPSNWQSCLRVGENKAELFNLLTKEVTRIQYQGKEMYSTHGVQVLASHRRADNSRIEPCSHDEADTRMMLHIKDAAHDKHEKT